MCFESEYERLLVIDEDSDDSTSRILALPRKVKYTTVQWKKAGRASRRLISRCGRFFVRSLLLFFCIKFEKNE
ncbi:unnamed protein product [Bursaphelenchus xylophilus]|uniref:(pine wood nematode) hypothetical protein n=1 Tax=Bursaphelenchus xylophilus TaxID=6326 RepID=A0A1I7RVK9_BURXY|nr:unnamed protein product [Bursaphelenchus xylophilus]CAG9081825.1 unnamed protein product [Bursaphelenchus xylophilus]